MKLCVLIAGVAFAAIGSSAHAATIERTFDVVAADFLLASGSSTPAPVDPVHLNFTLVFDPSVVIAPTTTGLTINAFTFSYPVIFASDGAGHIALGQVLDSARECVFGGETFCFSLTGPASASPMATYDQFTGGGDWFAASVTVNASPPGIIAVPEPSTWALMLMGFGGVGWLAHRGRGAPAHAA